MNPNRIYSEIMSELGVDPLCGYSSGEIPLASDTGVWATPEDMKRIAEDSLEGRPNTSV